MMYVFDRPPASGGRRPPERGAIVPLAAIVLVLLLGFCALGLNAGYRSVARKELQNGVDAAALAGAETLTGTSVGIFRAPFRARSIARRNRVWSQRLGLNTDDIVPGYWDSTALTFSAVGDTIHIGRANILLSLDEPQYFNAVRVSAATDGDGNHPLVQAILWTPTGSPCLDIRGTAVGVGGGACSDATGCTLPLVLPSCAMTNDFGDSICGTVQTLYFNHGNGKDLAFANVVDPAGNANTKIVGEQMKAGAACSNPEVDVGQDVPLMNGNNFNSIEPNMRDPNNIVCTNGGGAPYDSCPHEQVPVAYIQDCSRPMNHSASTVGFARVVVLGTVPNGKDASITMYIDCTARSSTGSSGCGNFGYGGVLHLAQ